MSDMNILKGLSSIYGYYTYSVYILVPRCRVNVIRASFWMSLLREAGRTADTMFTTEYYYGVWQYALNARTPARVDQARSNWCGATAMCWNWL